MEQSGRTPWTPAWTAAAAGLSAAVAVLAVRSGALPFSPILLPVLAVVGAVVTTIVNIARDTWLRTHFYWWWLWLQVGGWVYWTATHGWGQWDAVTLVAGTAVFAALAPLCATPKREASAQIAQREMPEPTREAADRPLVVVRWEALLRHVLKQPVKVTKVVNWDNPRDGQRVHIDLAMGMTVRDVADACDRIAGAAKLRVGCNVRALESDHQGAAELDVMVRDCLVDEVLVEEDFSPVSVNDEFTVMNSPRGDNLDVCLREQSMVVGGAPGSGKTTLLHRLILRLARCVDALIWVIDLNGGGVAEPWIAPWARGEASRPVVDWIADNEAEAALLVATAIAVAKGRKTSREATRRKRAANSTVLPVDRKLPAIIVLTDEGGEVRQAISVLGQIVTTGASRIAQIGRAEAVRAIMSVLRGTADLLDKGLRVNAALRICLKMMEEGEYDHVLGMNPGRTKLLHIGTGYLLRGFVDARPVFGRTVNVRLDQIERAAIACADLRPVLDVDGLRDASRVRAVDVLEGRNPEDYLSLRPLADADEGCGYTGRWDRYATKLAEIRGDELPEEPEPEPSPRPATKTVPIVPFNSPLGDLLKAYGVLPAQPPAQPQPPRPELAKSVQMDAVAMEEEARRLVASWQDPTDVAPEPAQETATHGAVTTKTTASDNVLAVLRDAGRPLTPAEIRAELNARQQGINRTYLQTSILKPLLQAGEIAQTDGGAYYPLAQGG